MFYFCSRCITRMRNFLFLALALGTFSSCSTLNPQVMFQTPRDYDYSKDTSGAAEVKYYISPGDIIEMRIFTMDGFKIVDVTNPGLASNLQPYNYMVGPDSIVKLPIIGKTKLGGMTLAE